MFGQRLRLARKKAGLSMRDLAGRLSPPLSAQAISKYEGGRMMPSSAVLIDIGKTLDVSLDFLMGGQVEALEGIEFRKHSGWNLGIDPIPSMTGLLEAHGIKVIEADLPERFDGLACGVKRRGGRGDTDVVVTSRRTNVERRRLTLAHELAHRMIRDTGNPDIRVEKAMQRFAGAFVVPAEHLRAEVGSQRHGITYRELMRLKQFYGVSATAMLIRLRDVGILSAASIEYAFRTYARSWRTREPEPIADEERLGAFEKPMRFERLVWRALGDELISPVRAAELLKRSLNDVAREIRGPRDS